jgi:hypothetical protein
MKKRDLTPVLELTLGPKGETPKELCWELKEYDLVVWLYRTGDGKRISKLGLWTKKDFRQPKWERYDVEKTARSITLNPKNHTFKIETFPALLNRQRPNPQVLSPPNRVGGVIAAPAPQTT